jgi:hypothetical protein
MSTEKVAKPITRRKFVLTAIATTAVGVVAGCVAEQTKVLLENNTVSAHTKSSGTSCLPQGK